MKNLVQRGDTLTLKAPRALASGDGFLVGAIFAVAMIAAAQGDDVEGQREGVFTLPKTAAQAWTQGQKIYWDDANKRCDTDGTVGPLIGVAAEDAANPSGTGTVALNGDAPGGLEGPQAAVANIAAADANDLASAEALANATKATVNSLLAELRAAGIIKP
jgi:predicted RecA/RadA family phage recombinase